LLETDLPLKQLAKNTAFSSEIRLSLAFKQAYGLAPGQYRRKARMLRG
jgi:AraC-like DNA-binding protein